MGYVLVNVMNRATNGTQNGGDSARRTFSIHATSSVVDGSFRNRIYSIPLTFTLEFKLANTLTRTGSRICCVVTKKVLRLTNLGCVCQSVVEGDIR